MTFHGHIQNGLVVIDGRIALPDGTPVTVTPTTKSTEKTDGEGTTLYDRMKPIIGIAKHLPPDASTKIDEVLYGRGDQ